MDIVPLARMSADYVYSSLDRNFSGNSVDPDHSMISYFIMPHLIWVNSFPWYPYRDTHKQWVMMEPGELIIKFTYM